jgi:hypothetical protein
MPARRGAGFGVIGPPEKLSGGQGWKRVGWEVFLGLPRRPGRSAAFPLLLERG